MLILIYLLILNVKDIVVINAANNQWMDILIRQLLETSEFYQIMIFKNNFTSETVEENYVFQKLGASLPSLIIDLSKVTNKTRFLNVNRRTTVYIMLHILTKKNWINFDQVKANLDHLIHLPLPKYHPKCLVLSFRSNFDSNQFFESILLHAWSKKFLDFSILNISVTGVSKVLYYDPFDMIYISKEYTSKTNIFPDKVINTRGYELKLPYIAKLPYIIKNSSNYYDGVEFRILKYVASILNLKLIVIDYETEDLKTVIDDIESGVLNLLSFSLFVNHPVLKNFTRLVPGKVFTFDSFCAAVSPRFHSNSAMIYAPLKTMMLIIFGIGSVMVIIIAVDRLKITQKHLNHFEIVRLVLGAAGSKQPKKTRDRFIFISIVFLSFTYLEDIYSTFTDFELSNMEIPLQNFRDVLNSKMTLYTSAADYRWIFEYREQQLEEIRSKFKLSAVETCFRKITEGEAVICFTIKSKARMYQKMFKNVDTSSMIRIGKLKFLMGGKSFFFEPGFPLVEKFNIIITRMAESGTLEHWFRTSKYRNRALQHHKIDTDNYLIIPLITILIIGETASVVIFCFELTCRCFKKCS